jgi:hypothetical protein
LPALSLSLDHVVQPNGQPFRFLEHSGDHFQYSLFQLLRTVVFDGSTGVGAPTVGSDAATVVEIGAPEKFGAHVGHVCKVIARLHSAHLSTPSKDQAIT